MKQLSTTLQTDTFYTVEMYRAHYDTESQCWENEEEWRDEVYYVSELDSLSKKEFCNKLAEEFEPEYEGQNLMFVFWNRENAVVNYNHLTGECDIVGLIFIMMKFVKNSQKLVVT